MLVATLVMIVVRYQRVVGRLRRPLTTWGASWSRRVPPGAAGGRREPDSEYSDVASLTELERGRCRCGSQKVTRVSLSRFSSL